MTAIGPSGILQSFENLNIWRRNGERAPHKPLLILMALALFKQGVKDIPFREYENRLSELLREFAPQRRTLYPEAPFVRLKNDAIWEVTLGANREHILRENDLTKGQLRNLDATGHFSPDVQTFLQSDPNAITTIARVLLTAHFPESIHSDILDAVGLALDDATAYTNGADIAGGRSFEEILLRHHGGQLNAPVRTEHRPAGSFVEWHREQVFKGSARPL